MGDESMPLFLDWWNGVGCCHREGRRPDVAWIRALGLPLHIWGSAVFQEIGRRCGGFIVVDEATEKRKYLRWARILVRYTDEMPASADWGREKYFRHSHLG